MPKERTMISSLPARALAAAALTALLAGCSDAPGNSMPPGMGTGGTGGTPPVAGAIPCEVDRVLRAKCQGCHQTPPLFGAPMPILSYGDTQAQAITDKTQKVWQAMKTMVGTDRMPPPNTPTGPLTAAEKSTLLAWLNAGAPGSGNAECTSPPPPGPGPLPGPAALPCKPKYEFRASADGASAPFVVPVAGNTYQCFTFQVPFSPDEQAIAWAPIIDDARVIHHWILYGHNNNIMPNGCGDPGRVFLMGWAPGGQNGSLPADVGFELPDPGSWLTLEVHYNNKAGLTDARDRSGIAMCTTDTPRPKVAGVITLGSVGINIPAGADDFTVTSEITGIQTRAIPEPLHVLWTSPHMHVTGKRFHTDIVRGGAPQELVDVPAWDFNNQHAFLKDPDQTLIMPGDALRTTCTYKNPTQNAIRFGEKTENEMCFNFIAAYPITRVTLRQWVTR
jgi:hypothetical protein